MAEPGKESGGSANVRPRRSDFSEIPMFREGKGRGTWRLVTCDLEGAKGQ
jgi:hypothetical protein